MVSFGDSASGVFGQFDEYSRLLILVARGLFDGAVQLPPPRRFLLDGNDRIDGGGIDCRRFVFLET
ncbi:hypothetical protein DY000_02028705 [Brassica cretica]|uniref:Uncharacterized protein n=1 Tax=Brassica cretica TaxID=69181 RepID=A0ABQ7DYL7_BRACR|nr:hypothetical protein DY000_02028705 [Brassica cretica]